MPTESSQRDFYQCAFLPFTGCSACRGGEVYFLTQEKYYKVHKSPASDIRAGVPIQSLLLGCATSGSDCRRQFSAPVEWTFS